MRPHASQVVPKEEVQEKGGSRSVSELGGATTKALHNGRSHDPAGIVPLAACPRKLAQCDELGIYLIQVTPTCCGRTR